MNPTEIANVITATLEEHRATRDSLAQAIVTMLEPLPNGAVIKTESHTVEMRKIYCGCSQWSNHTWDVTGKEDGYIVDGNLIREENGTVWDGSNHHHRRTPFYLSDSENATALRLAAAKTLRSLSRELPEALAKYIAGKKTDIAETKAAQKALGAK